MLLVWDRQPQPCGHRLAPVLTLITVSSPAGQPLTRDLASLVKVCEIQTSEQSSGGPLRVLLSQCPTLPEASEFATVIGTSHAQ